MNKSFLELPEEKQERIVNAGLEVFAKNDYKHAVTDDIAAKAGISKGLLFYYFHNKEGLYCYLIDHVVFYTEKFILGEEYSQITDFFELLQYAAEKKMKMVKNMPFLLDFVMKAYFSDKNKKGSKLGDTLDPSSANKNFWGYFKNIDKSKFKNPDDMYTVLQMLWWLGEGYLLDRQRHGHRADMDDFLAKFKEWSILLKKLYYKEEYN